MMIARGGPGYTGLDKIRYLFIDGAYLREVMELFQQALYGGNDIPLYYPAIQGNHQKVFYYDCPPPQKQNESPFDHEKRVTAQEKLFATLHSIDGWHVATGSTRRSRQLRRMAQKEVDILIAVDMLTHCHNRNMHSATLLAGDLDFRPLIETLVREGMYVELQYERSSANAELVAGADARRELDLYGLHNMLDHAFRSANPLPNRYQSVVRTPDFVCEMLARLSDGRLIEFGSSGQGPMFTVSPQRPNMLYLMHEYRDAAFLQKIAEMQYGITNWKKL